jgi:hypothetical protein
MSENLAEEYGFLVRWRTEIGCGMGHGCWKPLGGGATLLSGGDGVDCAGRVQQSSAFRRALRTLYITNAAALGEAPVHLRTSSVFENFEPSESLAAMRPWI